MCRFRGSASHTKISWTIALLALALIACRLDRQIPLDEEARQYVRLAVALGERDPDALDFYAGAPDLVADVRRDPPPLATIGRDAAALADRLPELHVVDPVELQRVGVLVRNLRAIGARVDLLSGRRLPYDRESIAFFGVAPEPLDDDRLVAVRSRIAASVGGNGRLVDRYAAFASRFTIADDRLEPVLAAALDACREATRPHLVLPAAESATLEFVRNKPWGAFSRYLGNGRSRIQINRDFQFTVDQALQIACHEGYPGHHARNVVRTAAGTASGWPERSVQLAFSPESFVSEASGMAAVDVAFTPEARLAVVRDRLFPLAGLAPGGAAAHIAVEHLVGELQIVQADVARRYLDGALEFARAVTELEERALVPHAEALVKYMNQYRSYVTAYTAGAGHIVTRCGGQTTDVARWRCYLEDFTNP